MRKQELLQHVSGWVEEITVDTEIELVDVEYEKEGSEYYLRVFIDKSGGVDVEDCRFVTLGLGPYLDEADPISHSYTLEVSSPGLERPLKKPADFKRNIGSLVNLRTYQAIDGRKEFQGELLAYEADTVKINYQGNEMEIPRDQIAKARLAIEF